MAWTGKKSLTLVVVLILIVLGLITSFFTLNKSEENMSLIAKIHTSKGIIELELTPDKTPLTVANFVNLAKRGYYNGIKFHRVIDNFMIQGGDPSGTGSGGPGYQFEDEIDDTLRHDGAGVLSMANAGPATNGSQFFITHAPQPHLDGKHAVFGKVISGQEVVNSIKQGDQMEKVEIEGNTDTLFEQQAARLEEWNQILDKKYPKK